MDLLMKKFRIPILSDDGCRLREGAEPYFLPHQQAEIWCKGRRIGELGVLHPKVLKAWDWQHPVAMLELRVDPLAEAIALP